MHNEDEFVIRPSSITTICIIVFVVVDAELNPISKENKWTQSEHKRFRFGELLTDYEFTYLVSVLFYSAFYYKKKRKLNQLKEGQWYVVQYYTYPKIDLCPHRHLCYCCCWLLSGFVIFSMKYNFKWQTLSLKW